MRMARLAIMILLTVLLSACSTTAPKWMPATLTETKPAAPLAEYRIQTGDTFDIKFFYNPELNEMGVTVRPDGRITLQLANDVMVVGLTPAELTDLLKSKYAKDVEKPELAVILRSFTSQRVFVDGEVFKAGLVPLTQSMTVLQSISQAGGFKETARYDGVLVIRRTPDQKISTTVVDLEKALNFSDLSQDLYLRPNDIVYVPKSAIANVNLWVDQYIRRNVPIPIGVSAYAGGL